MFPPGRAKLWTRPCCTGSPTPSAKTIGTVVVTERAAFAAFVPLAKITSLPAFSNSRAAPASPVTSPLGEADADHELVALAIAQPSARRGVR